MCDDYAKQIMQLKTFIKLLPNIWTADGVAIEYTWPLHVRYFDGKTAVQSGWYAAERIDVIHATRDTIVLKLTDSAGQEYYRGIDRETHNEYSLPKHLFEQKEN